MQSTIIFQDPQLIFSDDEITKQLENMKNNLMEFSQYSIESEGKGFLEVQCGMIMCVNEWRSRLFGILEINSSELIPALQEDIEAIKKQIIKDEWIQYLTFVLHQMKVMDLLRQNFKDSSDRLKRFIHNNQHIIPSELAIDLIRNNSLLSTYFTYTIQQQEESEIPITQEQTDIIYNQNSTDNQTSENVFQDNENCENRVFEQYEDEQQSNQNEQIFFADQEYQFFMEGNNVASLNQQNGDFQINQEDEQTGIPLYFNLVSVS